MANQAEAAPVRGLLLIGAAVLIGALFLSKGFDNGGVTVRAEDLGVTTTVPANAGVGTQTDTTDDSVLNTGTTVFPPAELQVLVVNASGVAGAAGTVTTNLQNAGYTAAIPPAGAAPVPADVTVVYYFDDGTTSYQADATAVATALGIQPTQVQKMPDDPTAAFGDIGSAVVVVLLGVDVASTLPPA